MNQSTEQVTLGDMWPAFIIIGLCVLMIFFCIWMLYSTTKARDQRRNKLQNLYASGVINCISGTHMAGLMLAEGTNCEIYEYINAIVFKANGSDFNLEKAKITDISIKTDVEITSQYVSSVGGAVAGAVLFGPLGAIVGGRAKKKDNTMMNRYLIFTYLKGSAIDYVSFDVTYSYQDALHICNNFKSNPSSAKISMDL